MSGPVIGVTGLPCAGKSLAAEILAGGSVVRPAGELCKADDVGHEVLTRPEVVDRLRERFGPGAFADPAPAEVRRAIAARVFADPGQLAWLEELVHPLVADRVDGIIAAAGTRPVVVEAALLFAGKLDRRCDWILVVEADFEARLRRAAGRGWSRGELERRQERQIPLFEEAFAGPARDKLVFVTNNEDDGLLADRIAETLARRGAPAEGYGKFPEKRDENKGNQERIQHEQQ